MLRILLIWLLAFSFAFGYVDEDLDGVDDAVDKCPGTPFDVLVNADGCPLEEAGNFYIKLSTSYSIDEGNSSLTSYVTFSYSNTSWYFSLTGSYIVNNEETKNEIGDAYLFGSYILNWKNLYTQFGLNIKLPTSKVSKKIDYIPSVLIDTYLSNFDVFIYGDYTFTSEEGLKNSYNLSIGFGNQFTDRFYSSISFDYSQSNVSGYDDEEYISIYAIYDITEKYFASVLYSYGLNKSAIDHNIFGKIGYRF